MIDSCTGLAFELTDEQRLLRETVHDFVERECPKPVAREVEASGRFPQELARRIAAAGLNGIGIPERYGGQGGDIIDQVIVCEELSRSLAGLAWIWGIPVWSGAKAVIHHGSEEQRQAVLPGVADGSTRFAFALTEPGGGTDVLRAMRTRAHRVDGGWVLRGNKIWSTMSDVAGLIQVLARTSEGERAHHGLSMFLVAGDAPGLTATPIPKIGMRALHSCELAFEDVFVPDEMLLGEEGSGWRQVLTSLNSERIMTAAMCTGILRGVLEDAILYAQQREAFGKPIGAMQAIQHGIADIKMNLETAWLHTYRAAWLERAGRPCGVEAATAKVLASEHAVAAADYGIQVLGGYGYSEETDMQRYWRDARLYRIGPISSEMARNFIGESLGLPRSF
ncbi:MAG TPA: acyl-CoA dehydrogenase family protein [Solirubrobacteraceae bacterium]|jgi:alkylation response protein AidB-like acyl-CoA dehydrogenase|nr:acyl-CoA dehydrogenase family protein [Solirubrobacteraceae bacterium]